MMKLWHILLVYLMVKVASLTNSTPNIEKESPKYKFWRIRIEINMIDKDTIDYVHKKLGCGSRDYRKPYSHQNHGQYRWRCSHRDAYEVAKAIITICHYKER